MSFVSIAFLCSALGVVLLTFIFQFEEKRGFRFAEHARKRADLLVLRTFHGMHQGLHSFGKNVVRQTLHFIFHTLLLVFLKGIKRCEKGLRSMILTNKTLARNIERESETLNKLEEVALHKVATALSDTEKKAHKDRTLNGV